MRLSDSTVCANSAAQTAGTPITDLVGNFISDFCPPPAPIGACCLGDGCVAATSIDCSGQNGLYQGDETTCEAAACPEPLLGDLDGDGDVDLNDFSIFLGGFNGPFN